MLSAVKNVASVRLLLEELQKELGVGSIEVITTAGHDTQSAMAAVPAEEEDFIFISCGTWSLMGTEMNRPCTDKSALLCQLTADACQCTVYACPVEATVLGNVGIQLMSLGEIEDLGHLRRMIRASESLKKYEPKRRERDTG